MRVRAADLPDAADPAAIASAAWQKLGNYIGVAETAYEMLPRR